MVDVFEQVEEELRSDRYRRLARTWLPVVGVVLAVALIGALGFWGWQSWQTSRADAASVAYQKGMEALESNNLAGADTAFAEAAEKAGGGYKALALMQRAGVAVQQNKIPEAVALFDEAAKASRDPILADSAALKATYLLMDTASLGDVEKRLTPLTEDKRPMRPFAQEALAMARLQHGKTAEARSVLVQLQLGQDVPDSVRQRAQAAIEAIDSGTASAIPAIMRAQAALPTAPAQAQVQAAPQGAPAQSQPAPAARP